MSSLFRQEEIRTAAAAAASTSAAPGATTVSGSGSPPQSEAIACDDRLLCALRGPVNLLREEKLALLPLAEAVFDVDGCTRELGIRRAPLRSFLEEVMRHYRRNAYHNWQHGVDVLCSTHRLVARLMPGTPAVDRLALLTAAVAHDVDHVGCSNRHLVDLESEIARQFNDQSPLEHRSANFIFHLLSTERCSFWRPLSAEQKARFRAVVIRTILATDITDPDRQHLVKMHFSAAVDGGRFDVSNDDHRLALGTVLLKVADVGSAAAPYPHFSQWGKALFLETKEYQPDLGLPGFNKMQQGFLKGYAIPLFTLMEDSVGEAKSLGMVDAAKANLKVWQSMPEAARRKFLFGSSGSAGDGDHSNHDAAGGAGGGSPSARSKHK